MDRPSTGTRHSNWTSAPKIVLAQDRSAVRCSWSNNEPLRWCTNGCPVFSGWSSNACSVMCWVMRHCCGHKQGSAARLPLVLGLACPHLHHYPVAQEACMLCCLGVLVVCLHQPHLRLGMWAQAQGLGPCHVRDGHLVFAVN